MTTASDTTNSADQTQSRPFVAMIYLLSIGALLVSAYLTYNSIVKGTSPAGCGAGSGCAEVLGSKWSRVGGIPVSLAAVLTYLVVMIGVPMSLSRRKSKRSAGGAALSFAAAAMLGSAAWFIYLQAFVVGAFCPYCIAGHILGVLLAGLLVFRLRARHLLAGAVGLACVLVLAGVQIKTPAVLARLDTPANGTDSDVTHADRRTVTLLGGKLILHPDDEPLLGTPDATHVMVMMLDYACLHCRHTHGVIEQYQHTHPGELAVILLPTPMNRACNPHAPAETTQRFAESCELARIALAVFLADPDKYSDFDRWLFDPLAPRTADQARAEARRRIGDGAFEQIFHDPRIEQMIARNVRAYGLSGADRVPVLLVPGKPAAVGRVEDARMLGDLLQAAPASESHEPR